MPVTDLAERFGTPLVVYAEDALRERARMFQRAVPDALVVYGTKAFPNVALMRLLAEEGLGADVSTLGELAFAQPGRDRGRAAARAREQQVGRGAARGGRGRRARRPRRARRARRARPPPACAASSSASRRGSRRRRTSRSAPATAAPSSGSTRTTRSRRCAPRSPPGSTSRASTSTSARSSRTCARTCSRSRCSPSSPTAAGASSTGCRGRSTSAAASGSGTSRRSWSRRWRSSCGRSRPRSPATG